MESSIEVQLYQVGVLNQAWGSGLSHVERVVFAEQAKIPCEGRLFMDHLVDLIDLFVNEYAHQWDDLLRDVVDAIVKQLANLVKELVRERDVD